MKIIAGLGNPGQRYRNTRHNVGFRAIDRLVDRWRATGPNRKSQGELYHTSLSGEMVILVKPETFMNRSGVCVGSLFEFYKLTPEDLIVIHDDIDLQFLALRIKIGGGSGGHNGLKSIDERIGPQNNGYHRVRIGIGRPENNRIQPSEWVLQQFSGDESGKIGELLDMAADSVELIVKGKAFEAMNKFNRKDL